MEKAELIESIKTNTRYVVDALNRAHEVMLTKTATPTATTELEEQIVQDLEMFNMTLEQMKVVGDELERGAKRLGILMEKVA